MDFKKRLEKAIERGQRASADQQRQQQQRALSEEELRRLHSQLRLPLSEHIEHCLEQIPQHFPGFQYSTIVSDRGWGAAVSRDDIELSGGARHTHFSRLEVVVRPHSPYHVLEIAAKGTIRNKEVFNRSHFQRLTDADLDTFREMIDLWVLEYAELFAARQ
jgi:hypothetical protein